MEIITDKRVDIKTWFKCNNNCRFCVQAHKRNLGAKTTEEIKEDLEAAYKNGCKGVVFTGGEVTIRPDVFEIVSYAKKLKFNIIQIQTNARAFYYKKFCEKIIEAGANEFAPALHGHTAELHDYLTQSPGSFKQITTGLMHLKNLGQKIVSNTVVVKSNYRHLPEIMKLLLKLGTSQHQFAFVHILGNAEKNFDNIVPYKSMAMPYIKRAVQIGINHNIFVMVEAVPYCLMQGYEKHVSDLYIPMTEIRDNRKYSAAVVEDFTKVRKEICKIKISQCKECKYNLICEGPWREYPKKMGSSEFQPVKGKKITSPEEILKKKSMVAVVKTKDYSAVKDSISKALQLIGGLDAFVKKDDVVLLKPNMLDPLPPDKAATTHYLFVKAVIELVKKITDKVMVGDCSGGLDKNATEKAFEKSKVKEVINETNVVFRNFQKEEFIPKDINGYAVLERTDFASAVKEADIIINLPKLKTHGVTFYTGAIKNCFGCIHPLEREYLHKNFSDRIRFSQGLVDIYSHVRPQLNIMDAVVVMEGDEGPSYGDPKYVGLVLASEDGVALDAVACSIIGYNPMAMPTIIEAHKRGIGLGDVKDIKIVGENIEDVKVKDFKKNSLVDSINKYKKEKGFNEEFIFEPIVSKENCKKCGICAENCPVNAIILNPYPTIDRSKCIHCYCCHETCPNKGLTLIKRAKK